MSKENTKSGIQDKCCHNSDCDGFDTCEECWKDWNERNTKTNASVLAELLKNFDFQEDFIQEQIAEFIACPKKPYDCEHYGDIYPGCIACKIKWLKARWES